MGLSELIRAGSTFQRTRYTINTDALTSGSASLGTAYAVLSVTTNVPCRLRLYDNLASMNDSGEAARSFTNTSISSSTALIGDFSMSVANTEFTVDPTLYAAVQDTTSGYTYYKINGAASAPTITIFTYPIEDPTRVPTVGGIYNENNRRTLPSIVGSLSSTQLTSGSLGNTTVTIPQTYLLLSASLSSSAHVARLRLYSTTSSLYDAVEKARPFSVEASESARLIVDMILSQSLPTYFSPKIIGANLKNIKQSLNDMRGNANLISGENELYYILENISTAAGTADISASLHVYSLEE